MSNSIQHLQDAGVHFGYPRTRRHPSAAPFLYGTKDRTDLFDLTQTAARLEAAKEFVKALAMTGRQVVFVGGKNEAVKPIQEAAQRIGVPYVAGRWIGGTLTNFKNIRKRVERMEKLKADTESGELEKKYTKREQLLLSREVENLEFRFGGIVNMNDLPGAMFVVDSRHEAIAVKEANQLKIPVIALSSSDCDFARVQYPIPGNDTVQKSIRLAVDAIADAFAEGRRTAPAVGEKAVAK
jgi:small subunit ribosomal protein S2